MLPLMDLINHGNAGEANLKLFRDDKDDYIAYATRDISKGEEVTHPSLTPSPAPDSILKMFSYIGRS